MTTAVPVVTLSKKPRQPKSPADPVVQAYWRMRKAEKCWHAHDVVAPNDPTYERLARAARRARQEKEAALPATKRGVWIKASEAIEWLGFDPDYELGPFDSLLDPPPANPEEIEKVRAFLKSPIRIDYAWLQSLQALIGEIECAVGPRNPGVVSLKQIFNGMLMACEAEPLRRKSMITDRESQSR